MSGLETANQFKKFTFDLINKLELFNNSPGDKVVQQNSPVLDEEEAMLEDSCMYFIISGTYKVVSAMFDMSKQISQ